MVLTEVDERHESSHAPIFPLNPKTKRGLLLFIYCSGGPTWRLGGALAPPSPKIFP
jgi:hypothetical protein